MDKEKAIERVRKFLAMAERGDGASAETAEEAACAAARAAELMAKHGITEAEAAWTNDAKPREIEEQSADEFKNISTWRSIIAWGVAAGTGCKSYFSVTRRPSRIVKQMFVGAGDDVATACYMYSYLCNEVDRLAAEYSKATEGKLGKGHLQSFRYGAASTIATKMRAQRKETMDAARAGAGAATAGAIMRIDHEANKLARYMDGMRLKSHGFSGPSDAGAVQSGRAAGDSVRLVRLGGGRGISAGPGRLRAGALRLGSGE